MPNIGVKFGALSTCLKLGLTKIKQAYIGAVQIYTGCAPEPNKGACTDNTTGTATVKSYRDCCGNCNEKCSGDTPLKAWASAPCDAIGSGCCCEAESAVSVIKGTSSQITCEQCCAPSYYCSDFSKSVTSCADCPAGYTCRDFSWTDDEGTFYPYVECFLDHKVAATCDECPGIQCEPQTITGECSTWQPDCQISQIINSCWGAATSITVTLSATMPNRPGTAPNSYGVIWGPATMYPVGGWNGGAFKFSNGGNNGWVGIWPDCEGNWRIYAYGGYFPGWHTATENWPPPVYSQGGDGSPTKLQKWSTYKTGNGTCDPTGVGTATATLYDYSAPWGMPPGQVAEIEFPVTVTVTPA